MSPATTFSATLDRPTAQDDRRWLVLAVVAVAQLMVVLDATIVNIALPSAQQALGFSNGDRQWVVTAYALAFGSLLLVGGRLGDMFSRKWVFITGLVGFAIASAIGGGAGSFVVLITARALQGAFGAVLAPSALGTLVSTFTEPRERGRAFGVYGSVAASGGGVGLILGGVLTQYLSWRWCLYVNLLFAVIAVAGALTYIRAGRPAHPPRMDWPGAVLACTGLFAIVYGFSHAETAGWTAALTLGFLIGGVVLLAGFVVAEQRAPHPLLPLRVILDRARGGSYLALGISGIAIFGIFLFLTFYLQVIKGDSPLTTGLLFLPMIGGILVSSNLSSIINLGPRVLIATGLLLAAGGMGLLTQITVTSSYSSDVLPALIVIGLGLGLIFAKGINTATTGVARQDSGVASALVNTMQQVGGSIGTSALSTIALSATATYLIAHHTSPLAPAIAATHGYTVAFWVSTGLLGLGFILTVVLLPSRRQPARDVSAATPEARGPATPAAAPAQPAAAPPPRAAAPVPAAAVPAQQHAAAAIPVALCSCSPVIRSLAGSSGSPRPVSRP
ncbi:MAG: MFS transporter [Nocardiopsaceae bacterium]|jgi:EmrB/QacA subfamily drug resistance transporter|nr:MFS transporter [Nocardiopsaceae bacterium]